MKRLNTKKNRVIVAMSGGVDSSVAAALLKKRGFDVVGVFMHFWAEKPNKENISHKLENRCCSLEAEEQARKVAKILKIPFYVLNYEKEFKKYIVDYFIREYSRGNTPNPCIECNKKIKFGFLLDKIRVLKAEFLATGHYIRKIKARNKNIYKLFKAKDKNKDQSYFLYNLTQNNLSQLMFPLGNYTKPRVRELAKKFKLPTASRRESQDICFIPREGQEIFLKRYLKNIKPGLIIDTGGKKIGKHEGLPLYTIGQRKGIKIGGGKPYYVVDLDFKKNKLIVTNNPEDTNLYSKSLKVCEVNWISGHTPKLPMDLEAKIRYRQKAAKAKVYKDKKSKCMIVEFNKKQRAVTSGQSAVFYKGQEILGGGIIKTV